jgi:CRISPR-associated protein Cas2
MNFDQAIRELLHHEGSYSDHAADPGGSIVMILREREATGGIGLAHLGTPAKTLMEIDGMWIARAGL